MIERFGELPDGHGVERVRIGSGAMRAELLTYGARVTSLTLDGHAGSLVLGTSRIEPYLRDMAYYGALVGRFANRIGNAAFSIDGNRFDTTPNFRRRHTLHGGHDGLHGRLWQIADAGADHVVFTLVSPDGEEGFPGRLDVTARYEIVSTALVVTVEARSDRPTPCSIASHAYFWLGGGDVRTHRLSIAADRYLPVDDDLIPLGPPTSVAATVFDFRGKREIGHTRYDHNFCLSDGRVACRPVAILESADGAMAMTVSTTEPGLQLYDGANTALAVDEYGRALPPFAGLCLEAQAWPDAPNRPDFPDSILRPKQVYRSETRYDFSTRSS